MSILIITLAATPLDAATVCDYVLSHDGRTVAAQSQAPLALLPVIGQAGEVVLVVPARQLSWHHVQLPKGTLARQYWQDASPLRIRAVLDGLLEERLLDETAQLHFAIEPQPRPDAPVGVAVCDRAWLQAALQALEQAGRPVSRIVPEFAPDTLADTLYVTGTPDDAQMVFAAQGGVAVWPLTPAAVALLDWPEARPLVAEPAVAALAEHQFKRSVTLQPAAAQRLQAITSSWDLAQFEFLNSSRALIFKRMMAALGRFTSAPRWRAARFALLTLGLVNLVGLNAWAWKEQSLMNSRRAAVRELLTRTFPSVRVVVDAPLQMAREVATLQQLSGAPTTRDFDVMLSAVATAAPVNKAPAAIEFVAGELRLRGWQLPAQEVAPLAFKLKPQGYVVSAEGDSLLIKQDSGL
jgi:general secretion pathway protein L